MDVKRKVLGQVVQLVPVDSESARTPTVPNPECGDPEEAEKAG
jgi:hypothetical protein